MDKSIEQLASRYSAFSENEARGRSPLYKEFARFLAGEAEILDYLSKLPLLLFSERLCRIPLVVVVRAAHLRN